MKGSDYRFGKHRPLNETELWRLRLSVRLEVALRAGQGAGAPANGSRFEKILALLDHPDERPDDDCVDWMLSYASPRLLRRFIVRLRARLPRTGRLQRVRAMDPDRLLPREHIVPDWQVLSLRPSPRTILVSLAGNALRLNMPVQLFHALVAGSFDALAYLRDERRQRFAHGIPGLGASPVAIGGRLATILPADRHVAVLATSSGSVAALHVADALDARRVALFSPEAQAGVLDAIPSSAWPDATTTRLYFAARYARDRELASPWLAGPLGESVRWLDTDGHGTLAHLAYTPEFSSLLSWLGGTASHGEPASQLHGAR